MSEAATRPHSPPPHAAEGDVDRSREAIQEMFAGVAPRYDLLNHLLTGALDFIWRRKAARLLDPAPGDEVLDLCCGTGDQSLPLARRGARVVGADFCLPMLALARGKMTRFAEDRGRADRGAAARPGLAAADALALPFAGGSFAGATVSFGLRNVADLDAALRQLVRVLAAGGKLVILDCALPENRLLRAPYEFYARRILPAIGRLLSPRGSAYEYLPSSVLSFPQRGEMLDRMAAAGLSELAWHDLAGGAICLYYGRKIGGEAAAETAPERKPAAPEN